MAVPAREIGDDEVLTQFGKVEGGLPAFHESPRAKDRNGLSMILGQVSVDIACKLVQPDGCVDHHQCRVRTTTAQTLRQAQLVVEHAPTKRNPSHVRVYPSVTWDDNISEAFHLCFKDPGKVADEGNW